ncbi:MAG: hypothetical protein PHP01_07180 [Phycisphaerae bacterium]|nr:hypothetical protein [Phycisphaerae bacterium]
MDKRQKRLLANIVVVITFTIVVVAGFANLKNIINRSEAMRAMELLGKEVLQYRKEYGSLPSETYVRQFANRIGAVRLTDFRYRAPWIEFGCDPNTTVLIYSRKNYTGLTKSGGIVQWLGGKVEWLDKKRFDEIMEAQQQQMELQWLREHLQKSKNSF